MVLLLQDNWKYRIFLRDKFTFQYGATSTESAFAGVKKTVEFTFQYGATSTPYCFNCSIFIPIFTFQYGATSTLRLN